MSTDNKNTVTNRTIPIFILNFGWTAELTTKKYGSCADIYVEHTDEDGFKNFMLIDDGTVETTKTAYHIYASENLKDKVFEGYIETIEEFKTIMKVMGYTKSKDKEVIKTPNIWDNKVNDEWAVFTPQEIRSSFTGTQLCWLKSFADKYAEKQVKKTTAPVVSNQIEFLIKTLELIEKESNEDYAKVLAKNTLQELKNSALEK